MSRICPITGKKPMSGNNRSHSHTYRVEIDGQVCKVRMSARAYRTLNKSLKEN